MMRKDPASSARPYWHVDLKWICGILALFALGASLLLYNLSHLTERERAVDLSATVIAALFSREGLDDDSGVDELRDRAAATEADTIAPIEEFPWLQVSKSDVLALSPRELRIAIFRQITEPIYDRGVEAMAAEFTQDPEEREEFTKNASLLGFFTKSVHDSLRKAFWLMVAVTLILAGAVVYFSAGWGRLVSPGVLLAISSPLGALAGLLLLYPPTDGDSPFTSLPENISQEVGGSLSYSYGLAFVLGTLLLLSAFIGRIIQKNSHKKTS